MGCRWGGGPVQITLLTAPGVEHPVIGARAPYDLVFANILAGPLVALAPSVSAVVARGGYLMLAGLLQPQARRVVSAYSAQGLAAGVAGPPCRMAGAPSEEGAAGQPAGRPQGLQA
jgi:ribosomal protein L11 methyltransferase